jgi:hypothetical protein
MKIIDNLKKVAAAVALDDTKGGNFGTLVQNAAIDAITNGLDSNAARDYMSLFADNADQLRRLTTPEATDLNWFRESRAYIMGNGVCGTITGTRTHLNVRPELDADLPSTDPDGTVNKPFPIPQLP